MYCNGGRQFRREAFLFIFLESVVYVGNIYICVCVCVCVCVISLPTCTHLNNRVL